MSGVQLSPEERFYENVLGLSELIYDIVCDAKEKGFPVVSPEIIRFAISALSFLDKKSIIETFIDKSEHTCISCAGERNFVNHCWNKIHAKDKDFFLKNTNVLFNQLPPNRVKIFGEMFSAKDEDGNPIVNPEDEEEVWEYFHSLVKIAIKYVHEQRDPIILNRDGKEQKGYTNLNNAFPEMEIEKHAQKWDIYLPF
jgi:hypothetical protein